MASEDALKNIFPCDVALQHKIRYIALQQTDPNTAIPH